MTLSIWRYSHLILALVSSLFLLVLSVTGVILAAEPISNKLHPYSVKDAGELTLAETLTNLNSTYDEIISISQDRNEFVSISAIIDGQNEQFYIDPFTGEKLGTMIEKAPIFQFSTNLHRSLFLKTTGRFIIGLVSFLLLLIGASGIVLIAKRQGGFRYFFSPVVRENYSQFNHVVYSRITLIPILILALSGIYLSLLRFDIITEEPIVHDIDYDSLSETPQIPYQDFELFKNTSLNQLKELEYPFSEFVEDYYIIRLKDREVLLNQYTGGVITQKGQPVVHTASNWATILHTGDGSIVWSVILGLATLSIPFLMVTGFIIYFKRPRNRIKNKYAKNEAEYVILVGTEGGTTLQYAQEFHEKLSEAGRRSYLAQMNDYTTFEKMKQLIIITATYGQGEAPISANHFTKLLTECPQANSFTFAVVGFGSTSYPKFCEFAYEVHQGLKALENAKAKQEVFTVNDKSFEAFSNWTSAWAKEEGLSLHLTKNKIKLPKKQSTDFVVVNRLTKEDTFLLTLKNTNGVKTASGDLLAITPKEDGRERLYSIGDLGQGTVAISVKKQPNGLCSNYLGQLQEGEVLTGGVVKNPHFHLPNKAKETVLIATGTGIGPFLGMINSNTSNGKPKRKLRLYWGARTPEALELYDSLINQALFENKLDRFIPAYSQLQSEKVYVQHLIREDGQEIAKTLKSGGCVMICGSIAMQREVMKELQNICNCYLTKDLSHFQNRKQIKMDCY
ncbi:PepSY domain-containing protein [Galbibacter sp.]|uniref:PepSY domain-containing protein n=1 Tax=Galbibacter sp. TaxID=2918471 RepID=UPI003A9399AD